MATRIVQLGGGRNVNDQNVDRPKISERRNGLFSWSECRNQNVKNVFWVDQNYDDQNVENSIKNQKLDFRRSDFTYGFKTDQNAKIYISTTYGLLPMVTKACGGLG